VNELVKYVPEILLGIVIVGALIYAARKGLLQKAETTVKADISAGEARINSAIAQLHGQVTGAIQGVQSQITAIHAAVAGGTDTSAPPAAAPAAPAPPVDHAAIVTSAINGASTMLTAILGSNPDAAKILADRAAAPQVVIDRSKNDPFVSDWQPAGDMTAGQSLQTPAHTFTEDTERRVQFAANVTGVISVTITVNGAARPVANEEKIPFKAGDVAFFTVTASQGRGTGGVVLSATNK